MGWLGQDAHSVEGLPVAAAQSEGPAVALKERYSGDWICGIARVRASMQSVDAQRGRWIVIVTIVLGALIILGLNCFTLLAGRFHPLLLLKGFVAVFWFRAIWLGNETARGLLILLLWVVAFIC